MSTRITVVKIMAALGVGIFCMLCYKAPKSFATEKIAENVGEFEYLLSLGDIEETITSYFNDDKYYLFLPSGVSTWKVSNIDTDDSVWIHDDVLEFYNASKNETQEVPFIVMQSENVGSMFIDLEGNTREYLDSVKKMKLPARVEMFSADGSIDTDSDLKFIRTRGNGTFSGAKKPYEIKFQEKASVLGMKKSKKWVLLANHYDRSLLRNKLVYDFAENYTSLASEDGRYVDVYINGEFMGNYYICEKVEVAKNRVNITDQDEILDNIDITGGYLVELMPEGLLTDETAYFTTNSGFHYEIKSPENPTKEQIAYIKGVFDDLESAAKSEDGYSKISGRHYSEIIDIDSYVEKLLVENVFMNTDLNYNSQYYYKDSDSVDSKLYAGPVWDYDMAMHYNTESYVFNEYYLQGDLLKFDEVNQLCTYYYQNVFKPYVQNTLLNDLLNYTNFMRKSYEMNLARWNGTFGNYSYGYSTIEANVDFINDKLNERIEYMDEIFFNDSSDYCFVDFSGCSYTSKVKEGETLGQINGATANWYQLFDGWVLEETGEKVSEDTIVTGDTKLNAVMVDADIIMSSSLEDLQDSDIDLYGLNPDDLDRIADVLERMQQQ